MGKGSGGDGMTRGDRRRMRGGAAAGDAAARWRVIGVDLAEDEQALAVIDHDVRVLARKTVRVKCPAGCGAGLGGGAGPGEGFGQVTVACEPTGARWLQVQRLCAERGLPLVCIQPLISHIAREQRDSTGHETNELIA